MTAANGRLINEEEMGYVLQSLNAKASEAFATKKADDIMTGRFRDFTAIPLSTLLPTGSDQPAVYDASKLQTIILADGTAAKLWDESQMRKNLLPHVKKFIESPTMISK